MNSKLTPQFERAQDRYDEAGGIGAWVQQLWGMAMAHALAVGGPYLPRKTVTGVLHQLVDAVDSAADTGDRAESLVPTDISASVGAPGAVRRRSAFLADPALSTDIREWVSNSLHAFAALVGDAAFAAAVADVGPATAAALGLA